MVTIERTHFVGKFSSHTFRGFTLNLNLRLIKASWNGNRELKYLSLAFIFGKIAWSIYVANCLYPYTLISTDRCCRHIGHWLSCSNTLLLHPIHKQLCPHVDTICGLLTKQTRHATPSSSHSTSSPSGWGLIWTTSTWTLVPLWCERPLLLPLCPELHCALLRMWPYRASLFAISIPQYLHVYVLGCGMFSISKVIWPLKNSILNSTQLSLNSHRIS